MDEILEINADQAVKVLINAIAENGIIFDLSFFDKDKNAYNVSAISFTLTISDEGLRKKIYQIAPAQWDRPATNRIKKVVNLLPFPSATYKVDLTTNTDGFVQTIMDGDMVVRRRLKY